MSASPQRTCTACRTRRPQAELLRFARRRDGEIIASMRRRSRPHGRSAYVCATSACVERAVSRRGLTRSLGRTGLVVRLVANAEVLRTASVHALDHEVEMLSRAGTSVSPRLPQLQALLQSLRPERSA